MDISDHDMQDWKQQAQKALAMNKSPNAIVRVLVRAETLLALIELAEGTNDVLRGEISALRKKLDEQDKEREALVEIG